MTTMIINFGKSANGRAHSHVGYRLHEKMWLWESQNIWNDMTVNPLEWSKVEDQPFTGDEDPEWGSHTEERVIVARYKRWRYAHKVR